MRESPDVPDRERLVRRQFVSAGASAAAALMLASCRTDAITPPATEHDETVDKDRTAESKPAPPPAESLSRDAFLQYLDVRGQANMERCHHCAHASFLTLQIGFGLPGGPILKALTPLPGVAERGETCGAVTGSLMALGLIFGCEQVGDVATWQECLVPARKFCSRFEQELGSTQCGDLLEKHFGKRFDLSDPRERAEFIGSHPGPSEICGGVVRTAVRIAAEVVFETRANRHPGSNPSSLR